MPPRRPASPARPRVPPPPIRPPVTPRPRPTPVIRTPRRLAAVASGDWLGTITTVVTLIAGLMAVVLVAFIITMFVTGKWPTTITVSAPAVTVPVTVVPTPWPTLSLPTQQDRPIPQFKAVERAKEGNTFDKRGCYSWYDSQGFDGDGDEFWNEGTQTCR